MLECCSRFIMFYKFRQIQRNDDGQFILFSIHVILLYSRFSSEVNVNVNVIQH